MKETTIWSRGETEPKGKNEDILLICDSNVCVLTRRDATLYIYLVSPLYIYIYFFSFLAHSTRRLRRFGHFCFLFYLFLLFLFVSFFLRRWGLGSKRQFTCFYSPIPFFFLSSFYCYYCCCYYNFPQMQFHSSQSWSFSSLPSSIVADKLSAFFFLSLLKYFSFLSFSSFLSGNNISLLLERSGSHLQSFCDR